MTDLSSRRPDRQGLFFWLALAGAGVLALALGRVELKWAVVWVSGLLVGFILHRSQFCFAASFRDRFLFRDNQMLRALVVLFIVGSGGFAILTLLGLLPGFSYYWLSGPVTVWGGFIFGTGMVLAGACACTTLVRLGEGFILYALVGVSLVAGTLLGIYTFPLWQRLGGLQSLPPLPDLVGWPAAIALQVGGLALVWWWLGRR